jgi:transposase-like protein
MTTNEFNEERSKFLEEGQRLAQFQHTSIVRVFSLFEENNTAYMVMEYLKGKTLLEMVEQSGPLDERTVIQLIEQVADALELVHGANVLHRDIKPENVIVVSENRAVLVDFGTAREFAAGKTRKMTTMLTPGYAPLEQYGQHARFGVFTDVYALGASTYHLLTGQIPIQATDRAAGVELAAPVRLRSTISRHVSDAVMWAMEMRVDSRPQSALDFVQAMRGARSVTSNGGTRGSAASPQAAPNPYQGRIDQLIADLESTEGGPVISPEESAGSVACTVYDSQIRVISEKLERIGAYLKIRLEDCPCCLQPSLGRVQTEKSPQCPVCRGARMRTKKLDQDLCPVCRDGHIIATKLESKMMFCPVCRSRSLREEKRKRFGLSIDLWWVCPGCSAEFDVVMGGRAKLVSAGTDPVGIGKDYVGETLPVSAWQQIAPLCGMFWSCDRCSAQFYDLGDSRLSLDWVERDPHDVKQRLLGKTYFRTVWVKIANGLSAKVGNTHCPACSASFDYDHVDGKLKLLDCDAARIPRAVPLLGQSHDLETWSLFAAGKNSLVPGWLCSRCGSEFDEEGLDMKWVSGPPSHHNLIGQTRSFGDWHRLARGLPGEEEETQLRENLKLLETKKREQEASELRAEQERSIAIERQYRERRAQTEKQLTNLVKQSFIGGFITLGLQTARLSVKRNERVLWESAAYRLKQRTSNGVPFWEGDEAGILVVTNQRVMFRADSGAIWSKTVNKLFSADHAYIGDQGICVLWIEGQQKPVAFGAVSATGTLSIGDMIFPIELTSHDLREVLHNRCIS